MKLLKEKTLCVIFCSISIVLFIILFYHSFGVSGIDMQDLEHISIQRDWLLGNIVLIAVSIFLLLIIYKGGSLFSTKQWDIFAVIVAACASLISVYWVYTSKVVPEYDQLFISQCAGAFNNGDFSSLNKGGYVGQCRHQLGIITLIRLLYLIFGNGNYKSFQYFSAILIFVLVFSGYQITKNLSSDNRIAKAYFLCFSLLCIPMYGYVPYVYGEICSTAFVMLAAWMLLSCMDRISCNKIIILGTSSGLAVLTRKNTMIVIIAFFIVIIGKLLNKEYKEKRKNILIIGGSILIGMLAFGILVKGLYADKTPVDSKTMPSILYIVMGTNDEGVNAGWHNAYNLNTFAGNDNNPEIASEIARKDLQKFIDKCLGNPGYAVDFYTRKMLEQWESPMYQCLALNRTFDGEQIGLAKMAYSEKGKAVLLKFMNIYQTLVYGGVLFLLINKRKLWKKLDRYVLLIAVFGGVVFSLIWEAKARYIFPYFIMMLPYSAIGIEIFIAKLLQNRQNVVKG